MSSSSNVQYISVYSYTPVSLAGDSYIKEEIFGRVSYENAYEITKNQGTNSTINDEFSDDTTIDASTDGTTTTSTQSGSVTLKTGSNVITSTNATLYATINNPSGLLITDCGIIVYKDGKEIDSKTETVNSDYKYAASVPMWYDLNAELGLTLTPGTTYTYKMYSVIGGTKQTSSTGTFTTKTK